MEKEEKGKMVMAVWLPSLPLPFRFRQSRREGVASMGELLMSSHSFLTPFPLLLLFFILPIPTKTHVEIPHIVVVFIRRHFIDLLSVSFLFFLHPPGSCSWDHHQDAVAMVTHQRCSRVANVHDAYIVFLPLFLLLPSSLWRQHSYAFLLHEMDSYSPQCVVPFPSTPPKWSERLCTSFRGMEAWNIEVLLLDIDESVMGSERVGFLPVRSHSHVEYFNHYQWISDVKE